MLSPLEWREAEPLASAAPMGAAAVPSASTARNPAFAGMGVGGVVEGADVVPPSPPAAVKNAVGAEVVPTAPPWPPAAPRGRQCQRCRLLVRRGPGRWRR